MAPRGFDRYMVAIGVGTHPKLAELTDSEFRAHLAGVLAVAAMAPVRGCLLVGQSPAQPVHVAVAAGVPQRVAASAMRKLEDVGILERDEEHDCLRVHGWDDVNPPPRNDPGNAERQRRYRERHSNGDNGPVTHDVTGPVTPSNAGEVEVEVEVPATQVNTSLSDADGADEKATDDDRRNCGLLRDLALQRNPKFKVRSRSRWLTDMRLLRERDGNTPDEIERAIRWVFLDDFWGGVIHSPGNLREHFPQVWDRMTNVANVVPLRRESAGDLIDAMRGAS